MSVIHLVFRLTMCSLFRLTRIRPQKSVINPIAAIRRTQMQIQAVGLAAHMRDASLGIYSILGAVP